MSIASTRPWSLGEWLDQSGVSAPSMPEWRAVAVSGVSDDSRRVRAGDAYLAMRGSRHDGRRFIADAVERGAAVVLAEADDDVAVDSAVANIPVIAIRGLGKRAGVLASVFFGEPSRALRVIAVTGTNGKTTTSWLVAGALQKAGRRAAVIGTLGAGKPGKCEALRNTTPGAVELQGVLAELREQGFQDVVMEASSIGIDQHRLEGTCVEIALFTNLSRDHLDYHASMEDYAEAKAKLFSWTGLSGAVINADDPWALQWLAAGRIRAPRVLTYGRAGRGHDIEIKTFVPTPTGTRAGFLVRGVPVSIETRLFGRFNAENLMAVAGALLLAGYAVEELPGLLTGLTPPDGRMQAFGGGEAPLCVVDYAHSPAALESVLDTLRERTGGMLWCVFGCGGDRDRGKRPQMGEVVARFADHIVLTSDNPRSEDPASIIAEIRKGIPADSRVCVDVEADRALAIALAVRQASPGDVVLVAGKGHEDYQEADGVRTPFSDAAVIRGVLAARGTGERPC